MTKPVQQKVGERSQRCAAWKTGEREKNRQRLQHADRQQGNAAAKTPLKRGHFFVVC